VLLHEFDASQEAVLLAIPAARHTTSVSTRSMHEGNRDRLYLANMMVLRGFQPPSTQMAKARAISSIVDVPEWGSPAPYTHASLWLPVVRACLSI